MENAATAVWLLEPSQRPERLRRRLKLALLDAWEEGNVQELMPAKARQGKRTAEERKARIRELAAELGLGDVGRLRYGQLIRAVSRTARYEDDELSPEDRTALAWRLCSAFAHGRNWSSFSWLDRQVVATEGDVHTLKLTGGDVERVVVLARYPIVLTRRALELYELRRRSPYSPS